MDVDTLDDMDSDIEGYMSDSDDQARSDILESATYQAFVCQRENPFTSTLRRFKKLRGCLYEYKAAQDMEKELQYLPETFYCGDR